MTNEQLLPYIFIALMIWLIIGGKTSKRKVSKLDKIYLSRFGGNKGRKTYCFRDVGGSISKNVNLN